MSKTPRTDELYKKYRGKTSSPDELMEYIELCEQLETELYDACREISSLRDQRSALGLELGMIKTVFRKYIEAENEWRASMFCEMHELNAARENVLALQKKAKEVLGL